MKQRNTVVTLALLGVLALAALAGGLLPLGNAVHAAPPVFDTTPDPGSRSVDENTPPGVNIGDPVSATDEDEDGAGNDDIEFGDTLTYSLSGTDAASFDIDASTGQLITKAPLDEETKDSYSVTVTVKDTSGTSVTQGVTINVTDVPEEPGAPAAPTVVATDTNAADYELKVIWYAPDDTGDGVTDYDVQYKKSTDASFTDDDHSGSTTSTTIADLEADTSYQVRVRAKNGANGPWSLSGVGSTNKKDNALPTFTDGASVTRNVLENSDPGLVVGPKVSATDDDHVLALAYELRGPDADSFDLQASTGQIRTKRGVVYDYETKRTLNVTMTVSDRQGGSDATAVTINVTNVPEAPSTPARPTVRATPGDSRSLEVSWVEPDNTGAAITGYNLRYREGNSGGFTLISPEGTGTTATIAPEDNVGTADVDERLTPGASYEVYVRAQNGESPSEWSGAGTGRTSIGNSEPTFDDRDNVTPDVDGNLPAASTERTVAENTRAGQSVGRAVRAVDGNGDRRTYRLAAADAPNAEDLSKFAINESTGQILTKDPLNHEDTDCGYVDAPSQTTCTYTVKVQVWDGLDEDRDEEDTSTITDDIIDDTITVNIMVSDVAEKPAAPTVTVTSPTVANGVTDARLTVTWDRPENRGPAITGYVVECTGEGITTDNPCPQPVSPSLTEAVVTHEITVSPKDLTRLNSYRVRVRADNNEGQGAWSSWVTQSTSKAENTLPTFNPTPPLALYVAENAPSARQPLTSDEDGEDVANILKNDDDSDSPLTLRLEGPDAGRFDIVASTGQIRTRSKLNYEDTECNPEGTACSYSVRVKLSDPNGGSAFHPLTISVTDNDEEAPEKPAAPRVTATSGSGWSLQVTWNAPRNDGPPITDYQIRYRKTGDSAATWQQWSHAGTGRSAKITTIPDTDDTNTHVHLEPRKQYEVQVRALNGEADPLDFGADPNDNWSTSGRGTTGASNERPVFDSTLPVVVMLEVEENTRSGQSVGSAIEATDPGRP